ncbi:hypothetical protein OEW28_16520 [Defluviimonas sp. WL0002]|uniref:Uncharacterized protein n=1 Tax=Albidovulum marisflavi TaxID=2984159 RepID=A0ABT2ZGS9_9RHOB|nr:hypothetical protein [Defluviimonas sp. WL0002]MCV2870232.1 hypothetical protein [Defluviimonas sp. WL0002]
MTKELSTTRRDMLASASLADLVAVSGISTAAISEAAQVSTIEALFNEWKALRASPLPEVCPDALLDERCVALDAIERRIFGLPPASLRDLYIKVHMADLGGAFDGWDADLLATEAQQALGADAVTV